jgi:hypothetical protein
MTPPPINRAALPSKEERWNKVIRQDIRVAMRITMRIGLDQYQALYLLRELDWHRIGVN